MVRLIDYVAPKAASPHLGADACVQAALVWLPKEGRSAYALYFPDLLAGAILRPETCTWYGLVESLEELCEVAS